MTTAGHEPGRIRVALVITRGDDVGGANVHVRDLALGLRGDGHAVCVLAGGEGVFVDMLRALDVPVVVLPHLGRALRPWKDLLAFFEILRALRAFRPDIVGTHSSKAGWLGRLAARLLGLPVVFTAHGWAFSEGVPFLPRLAYCLAEKLAAGVGDHVIAVSEYDRRLALDLRITRPERITTVHNGIPPLPQAQRADCTRQPPTLLMVARFAPQKDHPTLLRALESLPPGLDWRLRLVGDGPQWQQARARIAAGPLASRIALPGHSAEVESELAGAQIFLLISNWEGFPISILEAMRAGLPVIASDVGGVREAVVDGVTGYLIPRGDAAALRDRLLQLIGDPALRAAMGQAGRLHYEARFTLEHMYRKTLAVYRSLLGRPDTARCIGGPA